MRKHTAISKFPIFLVSTLAGIELASCQIKPQLPRPESASDNRPEADFRTDRLPNNNYWRWHHNLSEDQLTVLRHRINELRFPQPAGAVERLLPVRGALFVPISTADHLGREDGLAVTTILECHVSLDYNLIVKRRLYRIDAKVKWHEVDESLFLERIK